jgi:D-sedoheptulose 7-phosphate isomerase
MDLHEHVFGYLGNLSTLLCKLSAEPIVKLVELLERAREEGHTVFVFGNGGSAATAAHFVCDLNKGTAAAQIIRIKAMCLSDNTPTVLAYANDKAYCVTYSEQLKNFAKHGDLVIGISGSGKSRNVLRAIEYANWIACDTVGLCGFDGGELAKMAQVCIHVPSGDMQQVEDAHLAVCHIVTQALAEACPHEEER